jgi:hypothetical protein
MSKWGLTYKAVEPVFPEEWNAIIDALNDLDKKVVGGLATFVGDGATKTFSIGHGIGAKTGNSDGGKGRIRAT